MSQVAVIKSKNKLKNCIFYKTIKSYNDPNLSLKSSDSSFTQVDFQKFGIVYFNKKYVQLLVCTYKHTHSFKILVNFNRTIFPGADPGFGQGGGPSF